MKTTIALIALAIASTSIANDVPTAEKATAHAALKQLLNDVAKAEPNAKPIEPTTPKPAPEPEVVEVTVDPEPFTPPTVDVAPIYRQNEERLGAAIARNREFLAQRKVKTTEARLEDIAALIASETKAASIEQKAKSPAPSTLPVTEPRTVAPAAKPPTPVPTPVPAASPAQPESPAPKAAQAPIQDNKPQGARPVILPSPRVLTPISTQVDAGDVTRWDGQIEAVIIGIRRKASGNPELQRVIDQLDGSRRSLPSALPGSNVQ